MSKQLLKEDEKGLLEKTTKHRKPIEWSIPRNDDRMPTVVHDDRSTLANDLKASHLKRIVCRFVVDAWELSHLQSDDLNIRGLLAKV